LNRPLALVIAGLLAALLLLGTIQKLDHDEIVHVHTAWMIFDGQVPARDFQVRHHPLYHWATAPLYAWFQDAGDVLIAHRGLMWANLIALTVLVVLAGRRLADTRVGLWSAVFLLTTTTLAVGTIEARPDPVQATLSFLAVLLLLPGVIESGETRLFTAGLITGLALCVLQKALYGLIAAAPAVLWAAFRDAPPGRALARLVLFAVAMLLPVLLMVAYYNHVGALDDYLLYCWKWNAAYASSRQVRWEEVFRWFHRAPHVWVLAFAGGALALRRPAWGIAVAIPFAAQAAGVVLSGAQYKQYLLGLWPFAALLAGLAHTALLDRLRDARPYVLVLALVLIARPGRVWSIIVTERDLMLSSLEAIRFVQRATHLTERVFDDDHALNVMRHNTSFNWFGHEEDFADLSRAAGRPMRPDRVAELARHRPRIVVHALHKDARVNDYVRARYRPYLVKELWIASVRATADAAGRVRVDIPAAGRYRVRRSVRSLPAGPATLEGFAPGEDAVVELELP
jgi:4-amino-4-deoxy-L-arabinose transferase-like glycosyltransferase